MTRTNKTALVGGGLFVVLLLLLMRRSRNGSTVINNGSGLTLPNITLPGFDFTPASRPFQLPSMGADPMRLNMIGACCSDCSGAKPRSYVPVRSGPTFVTNEGAKGPNIFINIPPPAPPRISSGLWFGNSRGL